MLRTFAVFGILIASASAQDRWVYMRSDGFQMFTNAGAKAGRAELGSPGGVPLHTGQDSRQTGSGHQSAGAGAAI
jgi:hypothetical protein